MGGCISKPKKRRHNIVLKENDNYNYNKQQSIKIPPNFDINKSLVIFGQNEDKDNFMFSYNFQTNNFDEILLSRQGIITSESN